MLQQTIVKKLLGSLIVALTAWGGYDGACICPVVRLIIVSAERYHGPTAVTSLILSSKEKIDEMIDGTKDLSEDYVQGRQTTESINAILLKARNAFPWREITEAVEIHSDDKPVACPPQHFLEISLEAYFQEVNMRLPLFEESRLRQEIARHYANPAQQSSQPWNLCFNNIILLSSGMKMRRGISNVLDDDLFRTFLNNSLRGINSLDTLKDPGIVNVQAAASLVCSNLVLTLLRS